MPLAHLQKLKRDLSLSCLLEPIPSQSETFQMIYMSMLFQFINEKEPHSHLVRSQTNLKPNIHHHTQDDDAGNSKSEHINCTHRELFTRTYYIPSST